MTWPPRLADPFKLRTPKRPFSSAAYPIFLKRLVSVAARPAHQLPSALTWLSTPIWKAAPGASLAVCIEGYPCKKTPPRFGPPLGRPALQKTLGSILLARMQTEARSRGWRALRAADLFAAWVARASPCKNRSRRAPAAADLPVRLPISAADLLPRCQNGNSRRALRA